MTAELRERPVNRIRFVLPTEETLFAQARVDNLPFPTLPFVAPVDLVSTRRQQAGKAFQRARESRNLSPTDVRFGFNGRTQLVTIFETGGAPVSLPHVLHAAERYFKGEDSHMRELRNHTEDEQWIRTLTQPEMTFPRAITLMRLEMAQTKEVFAQNALVSVYNLSQIEAGKREPHPVTLNQLIAASNLVPEGIPAQIIRLMREKREPMSLLELQTCTFGELVRYIRQLKGLSPNNLGALLTPRKLYGSINNIEVSKTLKNKELGKQIITAFGVRSQSALAKVLTAKMDEPNKPIPQTLLTEVFTGENDGQFVFAEHIYETAHFPQLKPKKLLTELDRITNRFANSPEAKYLVNMLLLRLRKRNGFTQGEIARRSGIFRQQLGTLENNNNVPIDALVIKVLAGLGYDIHSPITAYILDVIDALARQDTSEFLVYDGQ